MAGEFADAFGMRSLAEQMGLAHDIGKYSRGFQDRILRDGPRVDHSTAGAHELLERGSWQGAYCVAGHHGGLPDGGTDADHEGAGTLASRMRAAKRGAIPDYDAFRDEVTLSAEALSSVRASEATSTPGLVFANAFATRMLFSCLVDADFLCTERFVAGHGRDALRSDPLDVLRDRFDAYVAGLPKGQPGSLNELRNELLAESLAAARSQPGVYSLTVPTGGGKTLESLGFALHHATHGANGMRRVIYAVPYTSIIEQNAQVFRSILGKENVLEHHSDFDFDDGSELGARLRLASENWDAPVVVTTNVQLFESLYADKTSRCRKLHNIARSVIVLDEAQMVPTDRLRPCVRALAELVRNYGCTVVLCTATQPALDDLFGEQGLEVREVVSDPQELAARLERVTYEFVGQLDDEALAQRIAAEPRVLCIVDNRSQAAKLHALLAERGIRGTFHLSTLMHPEHRAQVLAQVRERLRDADAECRLVATSLVEAGVDIDFPVVMRSCTGVDSVAQAAGRCNREGLLGRHGGRVLVFEPDESVSLPREVSHRAAVTRGVVRGLEGGWSRVGSLGAFRTYFERLLALRGDALDKDGTVRELSTPSMCCGGRALSVPFKRVAERFRLIEDGSVPVIVPGPSVSPELEALRDGRATRAAMRRLGRRCVHLYDHDIKRLLAAGAIEQVGESLYLLLDEDLYSERTGLDTHGGGKGVFL